MKQLYFYMFNVIMLIYIYFPNWPNINTSGTVVDRERFFVFKGKALSPKVWAPIR